MHAQYRLVVTTEALCTHKQAVQRHKQWVSAVLLSPSWHQHGAMNMIESLFVESSQRETFVENHSAWRGLGKTVLHRDV